MGELFIGTGGYTYKEWRDVFYPKGVAQKDWLSYYAQRYNTVEINATFYRNFPTSVYEKWHASTPPGFRFTLKGLQAITHEKQLLNVQEELVPFIENAKALKEKLAVMLWQFPPSVPFNFLFNRLEQFLPQLPTDVQQVFDFRHTSWFNERLYALLNQYNAGFAINDTDGFPTREMVTGKAMYVRFHGYGKFHSSLYSMEEMTTWAQKMKPRLGEYDVYAYFNNDYEGRALRNANELRDLITGSAP